MNKKKYILEKHELPISLENNINIFLYCNNLNIRPKNNIFFTIMNSLKKKKNKDDLLISIANI